MDEPSDQDWQVRLSETLNGVADIESLAFVTLMEAATSAQDDVRAIIAGVKAINAAKRRQRELLRRINRDVAAAAVAHAEGNGVAFSPDGLGGEHAYQEVEIAIPDPESSGGVQFATVALADRKITSKAQLDAAAEAIRDGLDSMSELGEMESLRLQMAMDRLSKLMSSLSNILKKISDTSQSLTQNLK